MTMNPHLLSFNYLTCSAGHQRHTSQEAKCTCGKWECWSPFRDEVEEAHNLHLTYIAKKKEEAFVRQYHRDVTLHELNWRGPTAASCKGCSWSVYGMDASRIREAFSNHMESVRRELDQR